MLTTAANNALAADTTVPEGVEATAKNGDLTLTGTVQYLSQRPAVEKVVSGLIGVRHVRNETGVISGVEPADVELLIWRALDRSALVPDDSDVQVDTSGSTVILTGHVRTGAERDAVVGAAWMARGVAMVVDKLEVTG
jgi:osmotically-inducible protein OsmY